MRVLFGFAVMVVGLACTAEERDFALGASGASGAGAGGQGGQVGFAVVSISPTNNATKVSPGSEIVIEFNEAVDQTSVNPSSVNLRRGEGQPELYDLSVSGSKVTLKAKAPGLSLFAAYAGLVSGEVASSEGVKLGQDYSFGFETQDGDWATPQTLSEPKTNQSTPKLQFASLSVSAADNGHVLVAWEQDLSTLASLWFRRFRPDSGWGTSRMLEADTTLAAYSPNLALFPDGNGVAVYTKSTLGGTIKYSQYRADFDGSSGQFEGEAPLGKAQDQEATPRVTVNTKGQALAVWDEVPTGKSTKGLFALRRKGSGWEPTASTIVAAGGSATVGKPEVAMGENGDMLAAFNRASGIFASTRTTSDSSWGQEALLQSTTSKSRTLAPLVMPNGDNIVACSYGNEVSLFQASAGASKWQATKLGSGLIVRTALLSTGGLIATWINSSKSLMSRAYVNGKWQGTPAEIAKGALATGGLALLTDSVGNLVVVWVAEDGPQQRVMASRRTRGSSTWQAEEIGVANSVRNLAAAGDRSGAVTVAWAEAANATSPATYKARRFEGKP